MSGRAIPDVKQATSLLGQAGSPSCGLRTAGAIMAAAISRNLITELIYILYARINASAIRADRQDARQPRSMPHAATIELPRKKSNTWRLRSLFETIVSGWFPAALAKGRRKLADSATSHVPPGGSDGLLPSGRRLLLGQATIGSQRKIRNKWTLRRFSEAIVAGWSRRNHRNPLGIPAESEGQEKKSRFGTPSEAKSPAKRSFPMSKSGPVCAQKRSKRWQTAPKIVCALAAVSARRRVLGVPLPEQSKKSWQSFSRPGLIAGPDAVWYCRNPDPNPLRRAPS